MFAIIFHDDESHIFDHRELNNFHFDQGRELSFPLCEMDDLVIISNSIGPIALALTF